MATTKSKIKWPPEKAISFDLNMEGKPYMEIEYEKKRLPMAKYEALFGGEER